MIKVSGDFEGACVPPYYNEGCMNMDKVAYPSSLPWRALESSAEGLVCLTSSL